MDWDKEQGSFAVVGYGGILAMVLEHRPLPEVLHELALLIESQTQGTVASILLLSEDGKRLLNGAAPSLPLALNQAVHGIEIGPGVGSCGTAAYLGERVVVSDIDTHEYWQPFKAIPLDAGLKSCWSEPIKDVSGKVIGTFALYHDSIKAPTAHELDFIVKAGKLAALAIERCRDQRYLKLVEQVFSKMPMAFVITDDRWQIHYQNPAFAHWQQDLDQTLVPEQFLMTHSQELEKLHQTLSQGHSFSGEFEAEDQEGERRHIELLITPIADPQGEGAIYGWLMNDVSERKRAADVIQYQANFDALTGLANRFKLFACLEQACEASDTFVLMLMDIDRFKQVNDSLGHDSGDDMLKSVARRLGDLIPKDALLSRLGGDEFALYLPHLSKENSQQLAAAVVEAMKAPFEVSNSKLYSGVSIGLARYPEDGVKVEQLLCGADQAMYSAKAAGRGTWREFTPSMQQDANREARLGAALKEAVDRGLLQLVYQPIVDIQKKQIVAAEALLRWQHQGEAISPAEFIPLAESSGLIIELGRWVRQQALDLIARLEQAGTPIKISVNVSSFELWSTSLQQRLLAELCDTLSTAAEPLNGLILEITESLLLDKNAHLVSTLSKLRAKGAWIAIDDFGTGYSSLSYLASFPLDCIKLDKSFVASLHGCGKGKALTQAIIQMSSALELNLVAEGVETAEQLHFLASQQVSKVQGFYFYRPMEEAALLALLRD